MKEFIMVFFIAVIFIAIILIGYTFYLTYKEIKYLGLIDEIKRQWKNGK